MKENLEEIYSNIFENIQDYALVKEFVDGNDKFSLYHKTNMGYVLVEYRRQKLIELLISKGIQIGNSVDEIKPKYFKPIPPLIWDEEKKEWKQLTIEEFELFLKEKESEKKSRNK